jgi:hypothetical protein
MKPLRTGAVLLVATAAAVAAMLVTSAVDAGNEPTQSSENGGVAASVPQDYRAGLFALQTGRLTFGQLWFAASR